MKKVIVLFVAVVFAVLPSCQKTQLMLELNPQRNKVYINSSIKMGNLRSLVLVLETSPSTQSHRISFDWASDTWNDTDNKPQLIVCVGDRRTLVSSDKYTYKNNRNGSTLSLSVSLEYESEEDEVRFYLFDKSVIYDASKDILSYQSNEELFPIGSEDAKYKFVFISQTNIADIKKSDKNLYFRPIGTFILFKSKAKNNEKTNIIFESDCMSPFGEISLKNGFIASNSDKNRVTYKLNNNSDQSVYGIYCLLSDKHNGELVLSGIDGNENSKKTFTLSDISIFGGKTITVNNSPISDNYELRLHSNSENAKTIVYKVKKGEPFKCPQVTELFDIPYNREPAGGWSDERDNGIVKYRAGDMLTVDKDIDLYAIWYIKDLSKEKQTGSSVYKGVVKFVDGVNPPDRSQWQQVWRWMKTESYVGKTVPWSHEYGIYDTSQGYYSMCWAATASNVLHWWMERNADNIRRYGKYKGPYKYNGEAEESDIFKHFVDNWPNEGNNTADGFQWFLRGFGSKPNGGFLSDVLKKNYKIFDILRSASSGILKGKLAQFCEKALLNGDLLGLAMFDHEHSVWGVDFDADGFVKGFFVTDSRDWLYLTQQTAKRPCLKYVIVDYDNNYAISYFSTSSKGTPEKIGEIQSFSQCKEYWEEYFRNLR